eukprot:6893413-Prymnesium_polylepis.1
MNTIGCPRGGAVEGVRWGLGALSRKVVDDLVVCPARRRASHLARARPSPGYDVSPRLQHECLLWPQLHHRRATLQRDTP